MSEPEFICDLEQGTPEWYEIRRGVPTASKFKTLFAGLSGREAYAESLAGEINSGQLMESFQSPAMARGKEMEAEALERFSRYHLVELRRCGFVRRQLQSGRYVGCSPDALCEIGGAKTVVEIKTMKPQLMFRWRKAGYNPAELPNEHISQCLGALWVTGYDRVDLLIWYRGLTFDLHYTTFRKDHAPTLVAIERELNRFDLEVNALVEQAEGWSK